MKLNIEVDTSRNSLTVQLYRMRDEDYSALATEVLDRAKAFIKDLPQHTPDNDPKCDEFGNILSFD